MMPDVIVFTSDKHLWALRPFAWLFKKYWGTEQNVIVVGYTQPDFDLPGNFSFYSIATPQYPADKWVDGALDFFANYSSDRFIFMHEDYWFTREVDVGGISILSDLSRSNNDILRIDLTADRLYAGGMRDVFYHSRFDIVEAKDSPYQMSHQAGIFNTESYVRVLQTLAEDQHSAWSVEINGTYSVINFGDRMRVFGTRQYLIRYANALLKGKLDWSQIPLLRDDDYKAIVQWIPKEYFAGSENK